MTGRREWSDRVFGAVGFLSFWDRFGTPPMLVVLAASTGFSLAQAVQIFGVYTLLYAVGQPLWGLLSDRFGRLVVLRVALVGVIVGALASAASAPGEFGWLLAARAFTGLMVGCLYPSMLTLIGDTREGVERARSLSSLQVWAAMGSTLTTLLSGTLAALVSWRLSFGLTAAGALVLLWILRTVPTGAAVRSRPVLLDAVRLWPLTVYLLAMVEGALIFGGYAYVVPAMQEAGATVTTAGLLAAAYGIGIIAGATVVHRVGHRAGRTRLILVGGSLLALGHLSAWTFGTVPAYTVTAVALGLANAVIHVSLQGWATEVAPRARATSVALFAGSLFLGSSLFAFLTAELADAGRFPFVYALALAGTTALTLAAAALHHRWQRAEPGATAR